MLRQNRVFYALLAALIFLATPLCGIHILVHFHHLNGTEQPWSGLMLASYPLFVFLFVVFFVGNNQAKYNLKTRADVGAIEKDKLVAAEDLYSRAMILAGLLLAISLMTNSQGGALL